MTNIDRVLPKGILQKYQKNELKGNYNFTEGEYHLATFGFEKAMQILGQKTTRNW